MKPPAGLATRVVPAAAIRCVREFDLREHIPTIRTYLRDGDEVVRVAAIVTLSQWGDEESRPAIEEAAKPAFYPHSIYYKDWSLWAQASHAEKFTLHDSETGGSQKGTLSAPVSYLGGSWVRLWTATYVGHLQPEVFWIEGLQPQAGIVIRLTECRTEPRAPGRYEHIDQVTVNVVKMELETPEQDQEFHMNMGTATEGPTMPEIELRALVEPALEGIQYRFQVGNPETGQALVYEDAPAGYEHPLTIDSGWIVE